MRLYALPSLLALLLAQSACASAPQSDDEGSSDDALRTISAAEKVGELRFGSSQDVTYSDVPLYRALKISAHRGDVMDVWVRAGDGTGLDAKAWLVSASNQTIASNDDADANTSDAHVTATASSDGDHWVVFRDMHHRDGVFSVSLGARPSQPPIPDPVVVPVPVPSSGLAALPDGTYRVPATRFINAVAAAKCHSQFGLFTIVKAGRGLTVNGPRMTIDPLIGTGTIDTGRVKGTATYNPCSYCSDSHTTVYTMDGTLKYEGGKLSLDVTQTNSVYTQYWSGSIATTLFGQDVLPASVQRAKLSGAPRTDGCGWLWNVTVLRLADGTRLMSLPDYLGDVPVDANAWTPFGCTINPASLSFQASTGQVYAGQQMSSSSCSDTFQAPAWFSAP